MACDDIRVALLVAYSILTTNILLLNGSSITSSLGFLDTRSSDTCPEIGARNTCSINNCTLRWPEVSCHVVIKASHKTIENITDNNSYFRFLLTFRVLGSSPGDDTNATAHINENSVLVNRNVSSRNRTVCLGLDRVDISLDKAHELPATHEVSYVPLTFMFFLLGIVRIRIGAAFNSSHPLASVTLDEACLSRNGFCVTRFQTFEETTIFGDGTADIHTEAFWTPLREFIRTRLNGHIRLLNLLHAPSESAKIEDIISNMGDFGIEDLVVVGTHWYHVERRHLQNMSELKVLNISGNYVNTIDDNTFESIPKIERLDLSNNHLMNLPDSISSLERLKALDLSRNSKLQMKHNANKLKSITSLHWLNLSEVPLKSLESLKNLIEYKNNSEHNETRIQLLGLGLSSCGLTLSEDDVTFFDDMPYLLEIDLSRNHLSMLPPNLFRSLQNLQSLNLASNDLINGFRLEMGENGSLKLLDLSHNKLSNLESVYLSGRADEINLSQNAIVEWNKPDLFLETGGSNRTWVSRLNLTYNAITIISENMGNSLLHLDSVDLGENPFDCDNCGIPNFQRWLRQNKDTNILNLGTSDNLTCGGARRKGKEIIYFPFNNTLCLSVETDIKIEPFIVIGVPLMVVIALVFLTIIALYGYRFEIAYVRHLINIRRQRHLRENEFIGQYKYDAFVSYSVADRDWVVDELLIQLEEGPEKYRLCLHERDFVLGSIIANNIVDCMKKSRTTLVVLSPHFVRSQWCRWELEVANHKLFEDDREFLVLVELKRLNRKEIPQHLSYLLDTRTYLEWPAGQGPHPGAWRRLKYALGESLYQIRTREGVAEDNIETTSFCD